MDFLIDSAHAQNAAPQGDTFSLLMPMIIIFVAFYFLLIRPQKKRQKQHEEMVTALSTGDEVLTAGGMWGKVTAVSDHYITVTIAADVESKVQKATVSAGVPKGTFDAA